MVGKEVAADAEPIKDFPPYFQLSSSGLCKNIPPLSFFSSHIVMVNWHRPTLLVLPI